MPFERTPGSNPRGGPLSAAGWKYVLEPADKAQQTRKTGTPVQPPPGHRNWHTVVQLLNNSGFDVRRGEVLEIDDYLLDPMDNASLWLSGVTPDATHPGLAIALEPIPFNFSAPSLGPAAMNGTCIAIIDITSPTHRFARREPGQRMLKSADRGAVKILKVGAAADGGGFECAVHIIDDTPLWYLGITRKEYTQGGDDPFIELDLYKRDLIFNKWRKIPGGILFALDWFLNKDEVLEKKTKVRVDWYIDCWVVTDMYCSPTDLDEFNPTTPPSPGEMEANLQQMMQNVVNQVNQTLTGRGPSRAWPIVETSDAVYQAGHAAGSRFF